MDIQKLEKLGWCWNDESRTRSNTWRPFWKRWRQREGLRVRKAKVKRINDAIPAPTLPPKHPSIDTLETPSKPSPPKKGEKTTKPTKNLQQTLPCISLFSQFLCYFRGIPIWLTHRENKGRKERLLFSNEIVLLFWLWRSFKIFETLCPDTVSYRWVSWNQSIIISKEEKV